MKASEVFDAVVALAKEDVTLRADILNIAEGADPMAAFCAYVKRLGFAITPGDILTEGEEYSCNQLKSTNGGGVNPYAYFDDPFEMFIVRLKML